MSDQLHHGHKAYCNKEDHNQHSLTVFTGVVAIAMTSINY